MQAKLLAFAVVELHNDRARLQILQVLLLKHDPEQKPDELSTAVLHVDF